MLLLGHTSHHRDATAGAIACLPAPLVLAAAAGSYLAGPAATVAVATVPGAAGASAPG